MKFGRVDNPADINFFLPGDHQQTSVVLNNYKDDGLPSIYVGCAKWNKADLKVFCPRGTKDELSYYSSQFNSIELNATFYRIFPPEIFRMWYDKTPDYFRFYLKMYQRVSHWNRLLEVDSTIDSFLYNASNLRHKLGGIFIQFNKNFTPKDFDRVVTFVEKWPKEFPLAIEFRHTSWYNDKAVAEDLYQLLETHEIANVLVDTAGRRDLMHMRLTNHTAFVRYVGANHQTDYDRLNDWVERLKLWKEQGVKEIDFFIHQNIEKASPLLAAHLIKKLNNDLGTDLNIPEMAR